MKTIQEALRNIPAIDKILLVAKKDAQLIDMERVFLTQMIQKVIAKIRQQIVVGEMFDYTVEDIVQRTKMEIEQLVKLNLRRVINATGVILHTNLGRAPLGPRAVHAVNEIMQGYSTLELDMETGDRGSRYAHVAQRIAELTKAEAAIAVNNNAGAVLLAISTLAAGKEIIVSRGQLVEIGGAFRIPEVIQFGGAKMIEVGTTNKTRLSDYEQAITANTAAILKVHTSNYRIIGFSAQPETTDLVQLAHRYNIPILEDLGSGTLLPITNAKEGEPTVGEQVAAGMDVVTFSGDKLLGGSQAGIIVGKRTYLQKMKTHPLLRALRMDKLTLAALEGTLIDYQLGKGASDIPVCEMLSRTETELKQAAERLRNRLLDLEKKSCHIAVISLQSQAGGGSLPGIDLCSWGVAISADAMPVNEIEKRLRKRTIPIITRVQNNQVWLDVRCLMGSDESEIVRACYEILGGGADEV